MQGTHKHFGVFMCVMSVCLLWTQADPSQWLGSFFHSWQDKMSAERHGQRLSWDSSRIFWDMQQEILTKSDQASLILNIYSIPEGERSNFGQLSFGSFYICWSKTGFLCACCTLTAGRDAKPFHSPSAVMKASVLLLLLVKVSGWRAVVVQPGVTHPATCQGVQLSCAIVAFQMPTALSWMAEQNTN